MINFGNGLKECPVFREFRDVGEGIALGDFKKVAMNGGLLALYVVPVGGASDGGKALLSSSKATMLPKIGTVGILSQGGKKDD